MKDIVARINIKGKKFEILVDGEKAWEYRKGKVTDISEVLRVEQVFRDVRTAEVPTKEELLQAFGTTDVYKIAEKILKEGYLPLPSEYRKKLLEQMKRKIIDYICTNAVDPITNNPIPPQRVEIALEKARPKIDIMRPLEKQLDSIIECLQKILPMKFQKSIISFRIPPEISGKAYGLLKKHKVRKERWLQDGTLEIEIEVPAGIKDEIIGKISRYGKIEVEVK